jgi:hypothetical protein
MAKSIPIIVKAEWWLAVINQHYITPLVERRYTPPDWVVRVLDEMLRQGLRVRVSPHSGRFYRRMEVPK